MRMLIDAMIFLGSALMVYNIIRYARFVGESNKLEREGRSSSMLAVPLLLLIFFLIGYLIVGITGSADLLLAAILFGGSVFVFLLLAVMYSIIGHIRDVDGVLSSRYEEMKATVAELTRDSIATFRVNLTRDEIEERGGEGLYETDFESDRYSELLATRLQYVADPESAERLAAHFSREALAERYQEGRTEFIEEVPMRLNDGETSFVCFRALLTKKPVSGDAIAFIVERPLNEDVVSRTLLENVLMDQYDRIAYLIDGKYHMFIRNAKKNTEELIFPDDRETTYEYLYLNYILPAMPKDRERGALHNNPLRLSVIDKALAESGVYEVNVPLVIGGRTRYKHFAFYCIDSRTKFYLMLLSDSTEAQEEQILQNRKLTAALDDAVRSNLSRVRFFQNVSHDLRTPMNGILGFTGLAKKETDAGKVREYLDKVDASAQQLLRQIGDLLTMSLIDSDTLVISPAPIDLREVFRELESYAYVGREEKKLKIHFDAEGLTQPEVLCDAERLKQILERLIENACAFTEEGGDISLTAAQTAPADGKATYEFRIRNSAGGIPEEKLENIFRADAWKTDDIAEPIPGVGLGMTVSGELVRRMGGTVRATSEEDAWTEFLISLPLESAKTSAAAESGSASLAPARVLLVDDNEINREIGKLLLEAEGHEVEQAVNGEEAVKAVETGEYDLVLMDVQMPVMNGYEATKAIRALPDPARAGIPVVALTANAYQEDSNEAIESGMNGYVSKPIDPKELREAIAKALAGKRKD